MLSSFFLLVISQGATAAEFQPNGHTYTVLEGFRVEQIAGQPLVDRPVSADFDERERLYVTDSSGSNEEREIQLEKHPHCIVRLEDTNGDGKMYFAGDGARKNEDGFYWIMGRVDDVLNVSGWHPEGH